MMSALRHFTKLRPILREDGMTMIEVVVAALLLTLGSLAVLGLVSTQAHNTFRGEQSQVVSNRLQEEMERIKQVPYSKIALSGLPTDTSVTSDPRWRMSGTRYSVTQNGSTLRNLVYDGSSLDEGGTVSGGAISPAPETFSSGDVHGTIYRFVVWDDNPNCGEACPGTQDLKRVIVAIRLDTTAVGGARHYQELQSQIADPEAKVAGPHPPGSGDNSKPWTFFLTDTPCDQGDRQPISADHLLHNTNGVCGAGLKNSSNCTVAGCEPGAPDLMVTHAPPLVDESPLFDYATDMEPSVNPDQDKGLQMPKPSSTGCLSSLSQPLTNGSGTVTNDPDATRMQTIHKWLSAPMGNGSNVTLDGTGTLNLWTQTVNNQTYTGKVCIWLFERHPNPNGSGGPVETPAANVNGNVTYFTHSPAGGVWPSSWTEIHIPLHFTLSTPLTAASQLGVAIQVERSGTSGGGLQFMYDEPSFDSRLEVDTASTLPF
jgi:type II secretory pathway pseudopilin PulG